MLRFIVTLVALAVCAGSARAGRPAGGDLYYSCSRSFSGDNLGKVEWAYDGKSEFSLGTPAPLVHVTQPYGLAYLPDGDLLVAAGRGKNEVYKVNPATGAIAVQKNEWINPQHVVVEPGLENAWITDDRGFLFRTPLSPYGQAAQVRPSGSDNAVHTLAYKNADQAWYAASVEGDSTRFGILDPRTMATRRLSKIQPYINDMRYDPFSDKVLLCGDKTLAQLDPATGAVESQRVFKQVTEFYACVVDGEGHALLSSWNGYVYFIDYSATGKVGDSADFTDSLLLTEGMYYIAPLIGPGSPPAVHRPWFTGTRAVYGDGDGDGRIDHAVLEFARPAWQVPALLRLPEPGSPDRSLLLDSTAITRIDAVRLRADFPDRPFPFGTGVPPGTAGAILADTSVFGTGGIPIGDRAGPQITVAEAIPPQKRGDKAVLKVTFSEPVRVEKDSGGFPFLIKRAGADVNGKIRVESVRDLGGNRYQYTLASPEFPLLGDSIRLLPGSPQIADSAGNLNGMRIHIPVGGLPFPVFSILPDILPCVVSYGNLAQAPPRPDAILLVDPDRPGTCLNCADGRVDAILAGASSPAVAGFQPWLLAMKVQGPVRYDLAFYTTLGGFVNRASGFVDASVLKGMRSGPDGSYTLRMYWWPMTIGGAQAATGAYIVRGALSGEGLENPGLETAARPLSLPRKAEKIGFRFGYLRRD